MKKLFGRHCYNTTLCKTDIRLLINPVLVRGEGPSLGGLKAYEKLDLALKKRGNNPIKKGRLY